jgi:VanZ family protein
LTILYSGLSPFSISFTSDRWDHLFVGYPRPDISLVFFAPFGFAAFTRLQARLCRVKASVVALLSSASLALAIETLQAFDPGQISSITDAVLASLCAGLGVIAAQLLDSLQLESATK